MTRRKPSPLEQMASVIDGRLGDLLGQLGDALDEAAERLEQGDGGEIRRERQFDTGRGPVRASVGLKIRTLGGDATPGEGTRRPETPINMPRSDRPQAGSSDPPVSPKKPADGPRAQRVEATVFDEPRNFCVVADVPGIQAQDVTWSVDGQALSIEARSSSRHYRIETDLPEAWQGATFHCAVQNGILELSAEPEDT